MRTDQCNALLSRRPILQFSLIRLSPQRECLVRVYDHLPFDASPALSASRLRVNEQKLLHRSATLSSNFPNKEVTHRSLSKGGLCHRTYDSCENLDDKLSHPATAGSCYASFPMQTMFFDVRCPLFIYKERTAVDFSTVNLLHKNAGNSSGVWMLSKTS